MQGVARVLHGKSANIHHHTWELVRKKWNCIQVCRLYTEQTYRDASYALWCAGQFILENLPEIVTTKHFAHIMRSKSRPILKVIVFTTWVAKKNRSAWIIKSQMQAHTQQDREVDNRISSEQGGAGQEYVWSMSSLGPQGLDWRSTLVIAEQDFIQRKEHDDTYDQVSSFIWPKQGSVHCQISWRGSYKIDWVTAPVNI
jgi:hypothetical protein